jgi:hypothetical protein
MRPPKPRSIILLLTALSFGAGAVEEKTVSPIPLDKGTRWVYEANVKWTPFADTGLTGIQSARIKWTTEVVDSVQGKSVRAAVVHAFPMEILGMDPAKPDGYTVLIETSNRLYSASADTAAKASKLARKLATAPKQIATQAGVLLELPLHADERWGAFGEGPPREDGWYCWRVEAVKAQRLQVKGLSGDDYFGVTTVAFRTCPDHQVIDIATGVGITHLEYEHHGTIGWEDVRLVEFKPASAKPKAGARQARPR